MISKADEALPEERSSDSRTRPADHTTEGSPGGKMARLRPPHDAGVQGIEVHGDEETGFEHIPAKNYNAVMEVMKMQTLLKFRKKSWKLWTKTQPRQTSSGC